MRKKVINSQLSNVKTFQMYYRQMKNLAENVFKFNNLPEYIDLSYLNRTLLNNGAIAFFKDEVIDEVVALPFSSYGTLDMYGRPINIYVEGQNKYRRYLKRGEYVIMYDNTSHYSLKLDIAQLAERIALCVRTQDVNIVHQRTPRIWKCDSNTEKSVKDTINEIDFFIFKNATPGLHTGTCVIALLMRNTRPFGFCLYNTQLCFRKGFIYQIAISKIKSYLLPNNSPNINLTAI